MTSSSYISVVIGIGLALTILYRVRRDQLHGPFALWWLVVAGVAIVAPWFSKSFDAVARALGVAYPPALFLLLTVALILLKMLSMDRYRTRQEKKIRRLTQRLAMLEQEVAECRGVISAAGKQGAAAQGRVLPQDTDG